jgi:hypothetical protein
LSWEERDGKIVFDTWDLNINFQKLGMRKYTKVHRKHYVLLKYEVRIFGEKKISIINFIRRQ